MKTYHLFVTSVVALCLSMLPASLMAQGAKSEKPAGTLPDTEFAEKAAMGGLLEVKLGELAEKQGGSPKIKEFGKMMVTDHTKANEKLQALAAKKSISLPSSLDEKHQKKFDKLAKLSGAEFDSAYAKMMVKSHEKALRLFQKEANKGEDAELKAFAAETAPVIEAHLNHARQIDVELTK